MFKNLKSGFMTLALVSVLLMAVAATISCQDSAETPLVIGHLNSFTGSLSYFGDTHRNSTDLAAKHINDAGRRSRWGSATGSQRHGGKPGSGG